MKNLSRREFVKAGLLGSAVLSATPLRAEPQPKPDVWIFKGTDARALMTACMATVFANGGFGENVKKLGFKPNLAWSRLPEQGVCTDPDLVDVFLEQTMASGLTDIVIPERLKSWDDMALDRNGIGSVLKKNKLKATPTRSKSSNFTTITIPGAKSLKTVELCSELQECDAFVCMPVAKHHSGATFTGSMKNWMGTVKDPRWWHNNNLHQCIADFSLFMKPTWTIIDATRCLADKGPVGPSDVDPSIVIHPNEIILSHDPVAADAIASRHFQDSTDAIPYLLLAKEMGIGVIDRADMNIHEINV